MNFEVFNSKEIEQYKDEAKSKWAQTKAYKEYEQRNIPKAKYGQYTEEMMSIFADFGALRHLEHGSEAVQTQVAALQSYITENFYTCSKEILESLGQMYMQDERFWQNIDRAGGKGTAEFVSRAITVYCKA